MNQNPQTVTTISPFLDDDEPENHAEQWLDRLDCVLTRLYTERGSFTAALVEIGESMDWLVDAYARDAKPRLSPMELLDSAADCYGDSWSRPVRFA
jgi:hypothetical protein